MRCCAVIPAAGKGERLGGLCKALVPLNIAGTRVAIDQVLLASCVPDNFVIVQRYHAQAFHEWREKAPIKPQFAYQIVSYGTGDAIFAGYNLWKDFDRMLIIWGDQVFANPDTVKAALNRSYWAGSRTIVCPTIKKEKPYVDYVMLPNRPLKILKKRNLDTTRVIGVSDVGVFALPTKDLFKHWEDFCYQKIALNDVPIDTHEYDFLDFISFLVNDRGWMFDATVQAKSVFETFGMNTWEEVTFARKNLHKGM